MHSALSLNNFGVYSGAMISMLPGPVLVYEESVWDATGDWNSNKVICYRCGKRPMPLDDGGRPQSFRNHALYRTTMTPTLPPEILDLIIDHLRDEPITLESCCLVSKSWVLRTSRHLFARVEFDPGKSPIESWMKTFPDPSNSPAIYTRSLSISDLQNFTASGSSLQTWVCAFRNLEHMNINATWSMGVQGVLLPLHGLSPTLRSLSFACRAIQLPEVFDFVCSFPSLEDLELTAVARQGPDTWAIPQTSPKFTGVLHLGIGTKFAMQSAVRHLINLPHGLRFSEIFADGLWSTDLTTDLVPRCLDTLETLRIHRFSGALLSVSPVRRWLIT